MRSSLTSRCKPALVSAAARSAAAIGIGWFTGFGPTGRSPTDTAKPGRHRRGERRSAPRAGTRSSAFPEIEEDRAGEPDGRNVWQRRLGSVLPSYSLGVVEALRHVAAVQRRSERAQIDQEESIARQVAADPGVLAGHIG